MNSFHLHIKKKNILNAATMQELFSQYDIGLSSEELKKFQAFLEIFMEKNSQINLSAIRDERGIIEKHFIDSLMLAVFYDFSSDGTLSPQETHTTLTPNPSPLEERGKPKSKSIRIADLGTGGGFPGIPLAITHPDVAFTLIDSIAKKQKCVDGFSQTLGLKNITPLTGRAEELGQNPEYRESFDMVVSRATAYLPTLLEYSLPLLKVGGMLAAYKLTDKQEFQSMKKSLARLGGKIYKIKNYNLAGQDRSIVFIEKVAPTHKKYPRKVGEPLKNPII